MSNLEREHDVTRCPSAPSKLSVDTYPARASSIGGGLTIRRALPHRGRRLIGAWCFLDHFGPLAVTSEQPGMRVAPHPHIGLQTVTWLYDGAVFHRDSLGSAQLIRPGELNIMTGGRGISHSEETPADYRGLLHGLQLWLALPREAANAPPAFEHHAALPSYVYDGLHITVFVGSSRGRRSPATVYTELVGLDIVVPDAGEYAIPVQPHHEHGLLLTEGRATVGGKRLEPGTLGYVGTGYGEIHLSATGPARVAVVGGVPLGEDVMLWWNFVARHREEIEEAWDDWQAAHRFGTVYGYDGRRLRAPSLAWRR